MAAPMGHDRSRKVIDDDEEDPVDAMIKKTGCEKHHYEVQDCMAEHKDWRKCQPQVAALKKCISDNMRKSQKNSSPS